ncbi:hypothetical protein RUM44_008507 [Polyplax serrata]|uniref:MARVEL domain-containing protein n=1 Tax=Polyplax serrata TaxID=468196 RepID=A0ABR1B8Q0_POLSC
MNVVRCANAVGALPVVQQSCCCGLTQCCSCVNLTFLKTTEGMLKLAEIILGMICQNLLIGYGVTYSMSLGSSYYSFLTAVSASLLTSVVLLICYMVSTKSFQLIRQSLFEILFNGIASFLYLTSSSYLAFATYTFLYPVYKLTSIFQVYPAMSTTYVLGFVTGIVHGYDGWLAYKSYH